MIAFVLMALTALLALGNAARSDWKHEEFNAIPILLTSIFSLAVNYSFVETGFLLTNMLMGILAWQRMMRPGDMLLTILYTSVFSSIQAFFTFLTVTGVYLYAYPKIFNEKDWIPFAPAVLICFLLQLLLHTF